MDIFSRMPGPEVGQRRWRASKLGLSLAEASEGMESRVWEAQIEALSGGALFAGEQKFALWGVGGEKVIQRLAEIDDSTAGRCLQRPKGAVLVTLNLDIDGSRCPVPVVTGAVWGGPYC